MRDEPDRLVLSRDIEVIADRIALSGQPRRADELKVVAAHLRAKEAARSGPTPPEERPAPYVLAVALVMSWLAVVLLVVLLA